MEVTTALLWILAIVVALIVRLYRSRLNYWKDRGIAHDVPHPVYGNFQGLLQTRSFPDITGGLYKRHRGTGPFCGMHLMLTPIVMALDPALIKLMLIQDFSNFTDRGLYHNEEDDPLSGHLFLLDGQKWRVMRNKLSPTFTAGKMKFMFPTVLKVAQHFVDTVRAEKAKSDNIIEVKDLLARFTTDVIGTCAFGIDCNSLENPNAEFRIMGKAIFTDRRHSDLVMSLMQAFPKLARALHVCQVPQHINDFFIRIVRETVDYREKNNVQRNDFLNLLIEMNKNGKLLEENDELRGLTVEEMAAQVFVFFLGGFETSSSTMGFCLYELALQPELQNRLRAEIMEVLQRHNNELTYECLKEMHYMKQVLSETLRKYPILSHLSRKALTDYTVPGHPNYVIKKDMTIFIPVYGLHHDPLYYPDPEKFDPERFTPEQVQARDPATWLSFGDGPRNCIGMRFGQMQMRIGLVYFLKNFKLSVCEKTQIPLEMDPKNFLMNSKGGIYLKVEEV